MRAVLRDPRYTGALAVLAGVIVLGAVLARGGGEPASGAGPSAAAEDGTATPSAPSLLDARRQLDLAALAGALETYRQRNGSFPSTAGDFHTVCAQAFDPACALFSIDASLHAYDGDRPYWYRSDGAAFTLFARVDDTASGCPEDVPPQLADGPVFCLSGAGGTR